RQRLKLDLELEHLHAEKLKEVDRIKSRFFANISHEFRTPLTLIKGPVKQIMNGEFKGNLVELCRMILRNSDRLLGLINQLLDLSKLESGRMTLQVAKTDLVKFIKGLVLSFSSLAESKKISLKFNAEDDSIMGYIDRDKLEKIITNLLSNAFKFTLEQGMIEVQVCRGMACHAHNNNVIPTLSVIPAKAGIHKNNWIPHQVRDDSNSQFPVPNSDFVKITITNTGPGIPPDRLSKIFDRFYQVDDSVTRHQEGTGIGLALTKELVELHHGTINVECRGMARHAHDDPESDTKTIFTVQLPISKEHYKPEEILETEDRKPEAEKHMLSDSIPDEDIGYHIPDTEEQSESSGRSPASGLPSPLVLVVEDNPDVTTYIRSFLDQDYRIITAINGKEGSEKALKKYPDLIISDVMMPEMDGFELCHKLKSDENTSHIPIILLTAKADMDSKIEGLEFGADDYISKPFDDKELRVRVKNLIEQRKKLREKFTRMIEIKPGEIAATSMDEQFLKRLLDIFENHISETDYNTESFANEIGMSRSNLYRKIQVLTNQSTNDFIRSLRLKRAAQLLRKSTGTVSEIAYAVGFNSPSHFSKIFRQQFGSSPSDFANHGK
ncbi:MAG: response regulator, partial [Calditrichae bacterium]|nr:response regulator [Calditrichia bacterium]